jgi:hypothetical protein
LYRGFCWTFPYMCTMNPSLVHSLHYSPSSRYPYLKWLPQISMLHIHTWIENTFIVFAWEASLTPSLSFCSFTCSVSWFPWLSLQVLFGNRSSLLMSAITSLVKKPRLSFDYWRHLPVTLWPPFLLLLSCTYSALPTLLIINRALEVHSPLGTTA